MCLLNECVGKCTYKDEIILLYCPLLTPPAQIFVVVVAEIVCAIYTLFVVVVAKILSIA